jgi:hypothetical protein
VYEVIISVLAVDDRVEEIDSDRTQIVIIFFPFEFVFLGFRFGGRMRYFTADTSGYFVLVS